jgi:UDP-3-O-[3-hydroxymyristoyl] glucosamine N-acyltransferase
VIGERVTIGAETRLYPRVTVYAGAIGQRAIVHSGA